MEMRNVQVAAFFDPRVKLDWHSTQEQEGEGLAYVKEMLQEFEIFHRGNQNTKTVFLHIRMFIKGATSTRIARKFLSESYVKAICRGRNFSIFQWSNAILKRSATSFRSTKTPCMARVWLHCYICTTWVCFQHCWKLFYCKRSLTWQILSIQCYWLNAIMNYSKNSQLFRSIFLYIFLCVSFSFNNSWFLFLSIHFWEMKGNTKVTQQNKIVSFVIC